MIRNPFSRIRQETEQIAQRARHSPETQSQTTATSSGLRSIGIIDPASGALRPYGQLDFTPMEVGGGFVLA